MPGYVCIHGHFYQPPRENPWLGTVPLQPSAAPFHDWNARITDECYRPNCAARILGDEGRIRDVVNTYAHVSIDVGPTLLDWLARHAPDVHDGIVAGDRASVERTGHGTAIAQAYNHTILPLMPRRDKVTQVRWGLADFHHRFGRVSEGLWLPECAVDTETLEVAAAEGVRFVVLAPRQLEAVCDDGEWRPPRAEDSRRAWRVELPSGARIAVFAYDGDTSLAVAFNGLLHSGDRLADRLLSVLHHEDDALVHIATDGESYGHHHRHGEMALAWALKRLHDAPEAEVVPYAAYLETHPPVGAARIVEDSSWSCAHGVERWRSDCGCGTTPGGGHWRAPLRRAFEALRDAVDPLFEADARAFFDDPWRARDAWVQVLLEPDRVDAWLDAQARRPLDGQERVRARTLLHLQHMLLLTMTSCGWFFADLAGIEPVQDMSFAVRAADLATWLWPDRDWRGALLSDLALAHSNDPREGSGADLVHRRVEPLRFDGLRAAAHHALVRTVAPGSTWHGFTIDDEDRADRGDLEVHRVRVTERATGRRWQALTAVLHRGSDSMAGSWPDDGADLEALACSLQRPHSLEHLADHVLHGHDALVPGDRDRMAQAWRERCRTAQEHVDAAVQGVDADRPETLEHLAATVRDLSRLGAKLDRWAAQNVALAILRTRDHAPEGGPWTCARQAARDWLDLEV